MERIENMSSDLAEIYLVAPILSALVSWTSTRVPTMFIILNYAERIPLAYCCKGNEGIYGEYATG